MRRKLYFSAFIAFVFVSALFTEASAQITAKTSHDIQLLLQEKALRTPAQQKIDSRLLQAVREKRGQRMVTGVALDRADVGAEKDGRVKVDINAEVSDELLNKIKAIGGEIIYPSKEYHTLRALINLPAAETIAGYPEVRFIAPASKAMTVGSVDPALSSRNTTRQPVVIRTKGTSGSPLIKHSLAERKQRVRDAVKKYLQEHNEYNPSIFQSGLMSSQGDHAHRADETRDKYGYMGQGIKIGVLSDSYDALGVASVDVANGDLPGPGNPNGNTAPVTVLVDHAGSDEGRAMLQIVHDIAPKAQLFFASAFNGPAAFAESIVTLRKTYSCDIIIDDVFYDDEPVFQDGTIAQGVNKATAAGAMYFSSAGNEGSVAKGTAGVWEGDFNDAGSLPFTGSAKVGTIHNFGSVASPVNGDIITSKGNYYTLNWADPLGGSNNDYDLFLVSSTGTVKASSTNIQSGTQNAYEFISAPTLVTGDRLVVFKAAAAQVRAFSINAIRGRLTVATTGQTHGHSSAIDAFSVSAVPAATAYSTTTNPGPFPGVFTASNQVESFTSDGTRRVFYNADTTAITPGNFQFSTNGGIVRLKPDITAADGVGTTLGTASGLNPFYGTSASAPHAGAIAALLKSAKPALTSAQIKNIIISTALDIESPGYDNVSGNGIVQAYQAMQMVNPTPLATIKTGTVTATETTFSNSNGVIDPGEIANLTVQLTNPSLAGATGISATLTSITAGVQVTQPSASYSNIASSGSAVNTSTPFKFGVNSSVACGTVISFKLTVSFNGSASPLSFVISVSVGGGAAIFSQLGATPPTGANFTAVTGFQTGRLNRNTPISACGTQKTTPVLVANGSRAYDAYTFTNPGTSSACITVTMTSFGGANLYTAAYNESGFVPATPTQNFLGDPASSTNTQTFGVTVAAGKKFTVVVSAVNAGVAIGTSYTLSINYGACATPPTCTPVTVATSSIANGAKGSAYSQSFNASGGSGSYAFSLTGTLPPGLSFSGNSLSGTPTQAGSFPISITASDVAGCPAGTKNYTLVISGIPPSSVSATGGTPQTTAGCSTFPVTLQATVKDAGNNALSGVNVTFTAPSSGVGGTFSGGVTTITLVTDSTGIAAVPFTANGSIGSYVVTASVLGLTPTNFNLTNAPIIVTSSADSGPGTLRDVVANACPGATVTFDPGITSITLTSGEIAISKAINIVGRGAPKLAVSGNNSSRIFNITALNSVVLVSGLTLRDGNPPGGGLGGGAILVNTGSVTLSSCFITNNNASLSEYGEGGGIDNEGGTLVIDKCTIANNTSSADGGGITNYRGSTVITNSTIANNTAGANGLGGAIDSYTSLSLTNCTIFGNSAKTGGNINIDLGTITFKNTIIAGGALVGSGGTGVDISGSAFSSADYNLIQTTTGGSITGTTTHNVTGVSPNLMPLGYYGGSTPTLFPVQGSPVINVGDVALTSGTDQRGFARLVGARADIGAVEATAGYFSKSSGSLDQRSTWGTNADGSGTAPANFTAANQLFNIRNNASPSISNNWTVSGTNTSVLAGNGTDTLTLRVAAAKNFTVNGSASLSVQDHASVIFNPGAVFTIGAGTAADFSTRPVTFKSDATGTARLAAVAGTLSNATDVAVERYIPARRAWRLITAPLSNSNTIKGAWQNNGANIAGMGTFITGPAGTGLDNGNSYSLKTYDTATQQLLAVINTNVSLSPALATAANKGYFMFVRGDRNPLNLTPPNTNVTTLRTTGTLQVGTQTFTAAGTANKLTLVGNPYPSPVDFSLVTKNNVVNRFYAWDPTLNTVGGYVTVDDATNTGTYLVTPTSSQTSILQSSEAFFVQTATTAAASVVFNEANKSSVINNAGFRTGNDSNEVLKTSLFLRDDNTVTLADGVVVEFNNNNTKEVTTEDAPKMANINENLALQRDGKSLSIERRPLADVNDTLFLNLTNTTSRNYRFKFDPVNISPVVSAWLEDSYLKTRIPLSVTTATEVDFNVAANTPSANANRFRVVFKTASVLPVNITDVKAIQQNTGIDVQWKVATETNISKYEVEKSVDGRAFAKSAEQKAKANNTTAASYDWLDVNAIEGDNYYRIKVIENSGAAKYSQVVKVKVGKGPAEIVVYPNPVTNNTLTLQLNNQVKGSYTITLFNKLGQQVYQSKVSHSGGSSAQTLKINSHLSKGTYDLKVTGIESTMSQTIIIE